MGRQLKKVVDFKAVHGTGFSTLLETVEFVADEAVIDEDIQKHADFLSKKIFKEIQWIAKLTARIKNFSTECFKDLDIKDETLKTSHDYTVGELNEMDELPPMGENEKRISVKKMYNIKQIKS